MSEGVAFCSRCGYQIPQTQARPAPQAAPQPTSQPEPQFSFGSWNSEPAPQPTSQPEPQFSYGSWNSEPAPQSAAAVQAKPAAERYFPTACKVLTIIFTSLSILLVAIGCGVASATGVRYAEEEIIFMAAVPFVFMLPSVILMNKVPRVVAIVPVAYQLFIELANTVDGYRQPGVGQYVFYLVYLSFAILFLLQLVTKKKIFKILAVILIFLIAFHNIGKQGMIVLEEIGRNSIGVTFLRLSAFNFMVNYNIAMILLVFGIRSKKKQTEIDPYV